MRWFRRGPDRVSHQGPSDNAAATPVLSRDERSPGGPGTNWLGRRHGVVPAAMMVPGCRGRHGTKPGAMRVLLPLMLTVLSLPLLANAQVRETSDYLRRMDSNGDGRVSLAEYQAWMSYAFERMDRNGDGVLAADELPGGRGKPVSLAAHRESLAAAFRRQDSNRDGMLDARELAAPPPR